MIIFVYSWCVLKLRQSCVFTKYDQIWLAHKDWLFYNLISCIKEEEEVDDDPDVMDENEYLTKVINKGG